MTHKHTCFIVGLFIVASGLSAPGYAGDLEPSGPPTAGTMKPLDQVEPRIPIGQSDIPLTITASGSYYLVENISAPGFGITINADNVTLDLGGFTLAGPDTGVNYGIYMNGRENVEIRNGTVRDFTYGIYETSYNGKNHRMINLRVLSNRTAGILINGRKCHIRDCTVADNGASATGEVYGISVGNGSVITGNTISNNGYQATGTVHGLYASFGCIVTGNAVYENGSEKSGAVLYGIRAGTGSTLADNASNLNGTSALNTVIYGFYISAGCTVISNTACHNGSQAGGTTVNGFKIADNCLVDRNTAYGNNGPNMDVHTSCTTGLNHAP